MTVPYTFASASSPIPLSQLDANFAAIGSSQNINYNEGGTGAVTTSVQTKLQEIISVKDFGAVGNGVTNDTAAFLAAGVAATGKTLHIPPGTYLIKGFRIYSDTQVLCDGGVVLKNYDTTDMSGSNTIVNLDGDNIRWNGGKLQGVISSTFGVVPTPYYCMNVFQTGGNGKPNGVIIENLVVVGGREGIWCNQTSDMTIQNVTCTDQYEWGLAFPAATTDAETTRLIIKGYRAYRVGLYEGLKFASVYNSTGNSVQDIIIDDIILKDCGRLDPNTDNWQEGLDMFVGAGQRISVSNFIITGCGNGGIELKRANSPNITTNTLEFVQFKNGQISVDYDNAIGIALNWTAPLSSSPNTAGKLSIHNVQFNYTGTNPPVQSLGISCSAYTNVDISDCQFFGSWFWGVDITSVGTSSDDTARNVVIRDCRFQDVVRAIGIISGSYENVYLIDNIVKSTDDCIEIGSSVVSGSNFLLDGGKYETSGNTRFAVNITSNSSNVLIKNSYLIADGYAITATNSTGSVQNCNLVCSSAAACNISGGTWTLVNNIATIPTTSYLYINSASVKGWGNSRGGSATSPTLAAQVGEIVYNTAPASGGYLGWIATVSSNPATWKGFGVIA